MIIVDEQLVSSYPVFFEPKWKIFFKNVNREPTLRELAMLNHLAYGYFYERDEEGDVTCVLSCNENKSQHLLRSTMAVEFGSVKLLDKRRSEFYYTEYIEYDLSSNNK